MPATSTTSLFDFRTNFSEACVAILAAAGYNQAFLERQSSRLTAASRFEISFDLGEALNQETLDDGRKVYDFYNASLRVRIVTARVPKPTGGPDPARAVHDQFAAAVLAAFEECLQPFDSHLTWYVVRMIRPLGTTSGFDSLYAEDFTDVAFFLQFGVKREAWPALP